jgi:hypothetical protein
VKVCPHCGAENAETSEFCSLCLASFAMRSDVGGGTAQGGSQGTYPDPGQQPAQPYVSPGDYRALAQEMSQPQARPPSQGSAYYGAAMQHPEAIPSMRLPALAPRISTTDIAIMLLSFSLVTYIVLFSARFLLSIFLLGAAFGGSDAGFTIGIALLFIADALILAVGGYAISSRAMQRGRGWLFGAGCAACVVLIWQPLASLVFSLILSGDVYIPLFTLVGILFTVFLELPMGALGGWIAEKRLMS